MIKKIKDKKEILIILLSIIVLATTIFQRYGIENQNKVVDIVLDYDEMNEMAMQSDHELSWWFSNFSKFGVQYVGLLEETIESMIYDNKDVHAIMGWEVLQNNMEVKNYLGDLEETIKDKITKYDVLVATESEDSFKFIQNGLESRYSKDLFQILSDDGKYLILLKGDIYDTVYHPKTFSDVNDKGVGLKQNPYTSKLIKIGLGFDPEKINLIKDSGLEVFARPSNYSPWTMDQYIIALFQDFETYKIIPPAFIFTGNVILGYPNYSDLTTKYMQEQNIMVGLVESSVQRGHLEQEGIDELTRALDYNAVRIFSIWPYIQEKFKAYDYEGAEEIENTLYRAVTERNVRLVYFKPFKENKISYVTNFDEYEKMFERFEGRISEHGITIGRSEPFAPNRVRLAKQTVIGWGVVAAAILLLSHLFSGHKKLKDILLVLGLLLVPAAYFVKPQLMEKIMALGASIVFPSLAIAWLCKECKKYFYDPQKSDSLFSTIGIAIKTLLTASGISLIGAFFIAGILSNTEFLLEMDIFRGVKFSQMLPIALYVAIYLAYFGYKGKEKKEPNLTLEDMKKLLFEDIKVIYVLLGAVVLVAGYIYIARTGHETNIQPSTLEIMARNILEEKLIARPRNKEFLIAFPALMAAIYFATKRSTLFIFGAGLGAIIGQTSIANTFSHLRTPIYLSFMRTVYSLGIGIILGIVYIVILEMILKGMQSLFREANKGRN